MYADKLSSIKLPITGCLDEISLALESNHVTLNASTGSGKTTVVPLSLLDAPWLQSRKIIMLEPRRPAARMAAHRMAWLLGEKTGDTVGYQVRFERKISRNTRIEVLTEGLLLKRLQADPELADVGLIIFDEFHERSLVADVSLALCIDVCNALRDDLRLMVMSASLDSNKLVSLLNAKNISAEGKLHPVTIHYADQDFPVHEVVDACVPQIQKALNSVEGDVLVFLPGRGEITRVESIANDRWSQSCDVLTLFGDLSSAEQDKVLNPQQRNRRRLILSTDIAETSLTIEGIEAVVDGGRARKPVFQANSGLTRLEMRWISKASALQRTGRAGRLGPGHCFRAWTESHQQRLEDWITPEIMHADLAATVLEIATWGVSDAQQVAWLDEPPRGHWQQAVELLQRLQALDEQANVTKQGKAMSLLPVHPRLAHMLIHATRNMQQAADIAALLSDRDPFTRKKGQSLPIDIALRLTAINEYREKQKVSGCDSKRLRQLDRLSRQFIKTMDSNARGTDYSPSAGGCLALAYPDRVARRRANTNSYLMSNGKAVTVAEDDGLLSSEYLVIADLDAGQRDGRAWLAASIEQAEIERLFKGQIKTQRIITWDSKNQKVVARIRQTLGEMVMLEKQDALRQDDAVSEVILEQIRASGLGLFGKQEKFKLLCARINTIRKSEAESEAENDWPDTTESGLLNSLEEWLLPWLDKVQSIAQIRQINLVEALQAWIGWEKLQRLDELMPTSFLTPAGTQRKIVYELDEHPVLQVPLQEMLGVSETPAIANGRIKLVVHLLSPARRPLQVTSDLVAFWKGAYQEVKKEMRGRYPKHYWPDDPADSEATRFTKRRMKK